MMPTIDPSYRFSISGLSRMYNIIVIIAFTWTDDRTAGRLGPTWSYFMMQAKFMRGVNVFSKTLVMTLALARLKVTCCDITFRVFDMSLTSILSQERT